MTRHKLKMSYLLYYKKDQRCVLHRDILLGRREVNDSCLVNYEE